MSLDLLRFAAVLYLAAAAGYIAYFARPATTAAARVGAWLLTAAWALHVVSIGLACKEYGGLEFFTLRGGFVLMAWFVVTSYLVVQRFYHLPTVGAFVTPITILILLPTLFGSGGGAVGVAPATARYPFVTLHIMTAATGVGLFALAFGVALMYLLQEREVKGKRFGVLFSRLPALGSLDQLTVRLVTIGFVIFTVAMLSGALSARAVWKSAWSWDPQQVASLLVWLLYGAMLQARHSGWHGRRYAQLTMVGFALVMVFMVTLRSVPGITLHQGSYAPPLPAEVQP